MAPKNQDEILNGPDAAYDVGYACSSGAYDEEDNPFSEHTQEHIDWLVGFRDGEAHIRDRIRKWNKRHLNDHVVIVGSGRKTLIVCETACEQRRRAVLISSDAALCITARDIGCEFVIAKDDIPNQNELAMAAFERASLVVLTYDERARTSKARALLEALARGGPFSGEVFSINEAF